MRLTVIEKQLSEVEDDYQSLIEPYNKGNWSRSNYECMHYTLKDNLQKMRIRNAVATPLDQANYKNTDFSCIDTELVMS